MSSIGDYGFSLSLPPIAGTYYHVCPGSSSITGYYGKQIVGSASNDGRDPNFPLDSIATAYSKCVSGAGDGIVLWSYGTTTAACTSYLTSAITWSKHGITVVGACAPTRFNKRARIANKSTSTALANLITLSGNNNSFYNIALFNGGTTGAGGVYVSGARNYFYNVHMMGGRGMTTPTVADYSLNLVGAEENTFEKCVIGTDTFDQTDIAGGEILMSGGCSRNRFYDCEIVSFRSAGTTAGAILLSGGDSIYRHTLFDNCFFQMYRDGNVTAEASIIIGTVPNNGHFIFRNCDRHGYTDWGAVAATARVYSASKANAEASGITIAANPS